MNDVFSRSFFLTILLGLSLAGQPVSAQQAGADNDDSNVLF